MQPSDIQKKALSDLDRNDTFVFLETSRFSDENRRCLLFKKPLRILAAYGPGDTKWLYQEIERELAGGHYLAGWWSYEWGYALEGRLGHLLERHRPSMPLVWLGVFNPPIIWDADVLPSKPGFLTDDAGNNPGNPTCTRGKHTQLELDVTPGEFIHAVNSIKKYISNGETYQVNYTVRGRFRYPGDPVRLYTELGRKQAVSYAGLIHNQGFWILSLSPELFFRREGNRIWSKPMKGTIRRGKDPLEDVQLATHLANDPKNRAENVMIVDLLRNDLGRLCRHGSVRVPNLFKVERYETLFQMISRVDGILRRGLSWKDVFKALFPCGSITGAPKIRTMEIIAEIEASPRGVYTGAIGFIAPDNEAVFNVAIRTLTITNGTGELGIGSGITIDSDPEDEFEETLLKAKFLTDII